MNISFMTIKAIYSDPMLIYFPIISIFIAIISAILFIFIYTIFESFRFQFLQKFQLEKNILTSRKLLRTSFISLSKSSLALLIGAILFWPILRHSQVHFTNPDSSLSIIFKILLFLLIDDALFYLAHRLLLNGEDSFCTS